MKIIIKTIFAVFLFINLHAQFSEIHIGGGFGFGAIAGNSPNQSAYGSNLFLGFKNKLTGDVIFRLNYVYASKINSIIPEDRTGRYYPFIHIINLTASLNQDISDKIYIQGGTGLLLIQDRIFSDEDSFDIGIAIDGGIFVTMFNSNDSKLDLGIIGSFGETFTNSLASYNLYKLTLIYFL